MLIKYIKSVVWRLAKCLSYIEEARCLKVNTASSIVTLCKCPSGRQIEQELLDLPTGRPLTESDYNRFRINTSDFLMMSTCLLETCRGLK